MALHHRALVRKYNPSRYRSFFLGADVGGTNINIVLAGLAEHLEMLASFRFKTADFRDLNDPLEESLDYISSRYKVSVEAIVIAAAGPVKEHRWCRLTNADLEIDAGDLKDSLNLPCLILNDLEALGYSIGYLESESPQLLLELERAGKKPGKVAGTRAILAPGTGLGKAIVIRNSELGIDVVLPSEGGHADFAPQESLEWEMVNYLKEAGCWPVYYEDLLSGKGLGRIYSFLQWKNIYPTSRFTGILKESQDVAAAISRYYTKDEMARHAVEIFVKIYARCARNFALDVLARGGIYLGGGIAARNIGWFTDSIFAKEFENHRQYRSLLREIPLFLVTSYDAGMYGAACVASRGEKFWRKLAQ
jgi:glucokinase